MKEARESVQLGEAMPRGVTFADFTSKSDRNLRDRFWAALGEIAGLRKALAQSQEDAHTAGNVIRNLTEKLKRLEQNEAKAWALAYYDELTGLPNRRLLRDRLCQAIAQSARQNTQVALLFVDLDGFKGINDQLGHTAGDKLLRLVAERLTTSIRTADTASRYGGDEFVIMLPGVDHSTLCAAIASKVLSRVREPYVIDRSVVRISASIGSAFYPGDGQEHEELLSKADAALYRSKATSSKATIAALPDEIALLNDDSWALS